MFSSEGELLADVTRTTGCNLDSKMCVLSRDTILPCPVCPGPHLSPPPSPSSKNSVWSATPCGSEPMHFIRRGGRSVSSPESECVAVGAPGDAAAPIANVRCCADKRVSTTGADGDPVSSSTCATLGWEFKNIADMPDTCCATMLDGATCDKAPTDHISASSQCAAVGARLCTLTELQSNTCMGTGCGFDHKAVWTATACGPGQFYTTQGKALGVIPTVCEDAAAAAAVVRCCADR